jgi:hypothetical protein
VEQEVRSCMSASRQASLPSFMSGLVELKGIKRNEEQITKRMVKNKQINNQKLSKDFSFILFFFHHLHFLNGRKGKREGKHES